MTTLSILKIPEQFPGLLSMVESGEEIILEKSGESVAKIVPWGKKGKRKLGLEKGKIWMSDDFTDPLPQNILEEFYK